MKRYKLLTQDGYDSFVKGSTYDDNYSPRSWSVRDFVKQFPDDWEEVVEVVETDEEIVNKLVEEFWFDEEGAKEFLEKFKHLKEATTSTITIYEITKLIESFK